MDRWIEGERERNNGREGQQEQGPENSMIQMKPQMLFFVRFLLLMKIPKNMYTYTHKNMHAHLSYHCSGQGYRIAKAAHSGCEVLSPSVG